MRNYSLTRASDAELTRGMFALAAQDRVTTALLLAHIAEFDARRLYLPAAYPSMHAYCVGELRLSEDAAAKRIQAARVAVRFPRVFGLLENGELNLTAVCLIAPYLASECAGDLIRSAAGRTNQEIRQLIAARFPQTESLELVERTHGRSGDGNGPSNVPGTSTCAAITYESQHAAQHVESSTDTVAPSHPSDASERVGRGLAQQVGSPSTLTPTAHDRYTLRLSIGRSTRDKLEHARNLLGHALPAADLAEVVDRALDTLIQRLERRKVAAIQRPRPQGVRASRGGTARAGAAPRHIPAEVKRAVWKRDGGRCAYVSGGGRRCDARARLEFDHVQPVARGGASTVENLRLCCRAHNQFEAQRAYGAGFMREQRARARHESNAARRARATKRCAPSRLEAPGPAGTCPTGNDTGEITTPLRILGFAAAEARRAAEACRDMSDEPLELRLRHALAMLCPRRARSG